VPMLVRMRWLLETAPLREGLLFHRESNPACPSTRKTLEGRRPTTSASSIMNVSRR